MDPIEAELVHFLATKYPTATACRGLWRWSGGATADIDYDRIPDSLWTAMWRKAQPGPAPTAISVVRQALYDYPGQAALLAYLKRSTAREFPDGEICGRLLVPSLRKAAAQGNVDLVASALLLFPPLPIDQAFTVLAPSLERRILSTERTVLDQALGALEVADSVLSADWIAAACGFTLQIVESWAQGWRHPGNACYSVLAEIERILLRDAGPRENCRSVNQLISERGEQCQDPEIAAGLRAMQRQLVYGSTVARPPLHRLAVACRQGLWATRAAEPDTESQGVR